MPRRRTTPADIEAARQALLNAQASITIDRMHLADSEVLPDGSYPLAAQHALAEYDAVLAEIERSLKGLAC